MSATMRRAWHTCRALSRTSLHGFHSNDVTAPPPVCTRLQTYRAFSVPWPFSKSLQDYSIPNPTWSSEMLRLYDKYNSMCEAEADTGEKQTSPWRRLPSYNRTLKHTTGGTYLSKVVKAKARLFTRNTEEPGTTFEYVVFLNMRDKECVCIFQAGHLLEGAPGYVHGGAIATMIDSVAGTQTGYHVGPVVTANLNVNYRSPVTLGSVLLIYSTLEKTEGRKIYSRCRVTSPDGSKLHAEASVLFVSISMGSLLKP